MKINWASVLIFGGESGGTPTIISLSGITATKTKTVYHKNDEVETDDITVTAHYSNGTSATVSTASFGTVDTSSIGMKSLSVSYTEGNLTATCDISIAVVKQLASISATKTVTEYLVNEEFSTDDVVVTASYDDGTTSIVTSEAVIGTVDTSTAGTKPLDISYTEGDLTKTTSINIIVSEPVVLSSISATKTKTTYELNEDFSTDDVTVTASYSDGTTADVTSSSDFGTVDTSTEGDKSLDISYTEDGITKTTSIAVKVINSPELKIAKGYNTISGNPPYLSPNSDMASIYQDDDKTAMEFGAQGALTGVYLYPVPENVVAITAKSPNAKMADLFLYDSSEQKISYVAGNGQANETKYELLEQPSYFAATYSANVGHTWSDIDTSEFAFEFWDEIPLSTIYSVGKQVSAAQGDFVMANVSNDARCSLIGAQAYRSMFTEYHASFFNLQASKAIPARIPKKTYTKMKISSPGAKSQVFFMTSGSRRTGYTGDWSEGDYAEYNIPSDAIYFCVNFARLDDDTAAFNLDTTTFSVEFE